MPSVASEVSAASSQWAFSAPRPAASAETAETPFAALLETAPDNSPPPDRAPAPNRDAAPPSKNTAPASTTPSKKPAAQKTAQDKNQPTESPDAETASADDVTNVDLKASAEGVAVKTPDVPVEAVFGEEQPADTTDTETETESAEAPDETAAPVIVVAAAVTAPPAVPETTATGGEETDLLAAGKPVLPAAPEAPAAPAPAGAAADDAPVTDDAPPAEIAPQILTAEKPKASRAEAATQPKDNAPKPGSDLKTDTTTAAAESAKPADSEARPAQPQDKTLAKTPEAEQKSEKQETKAEAQGEKPRTPEAARTEAPRADAASTARTGTDGSQPVTAPSHQTIAQAQHSALNNVQNAPNAQSAASNPVPVAGVAVEIAAQARAGKNRFEIRLDPPELGRIDVRLEVDRHGHVTSRLTVERVETLDLLRRDAPQLERALEQAGLKTSDNGLQFSLRDQSQQNQNDENQSQTARLVIPDADIPSTPQTPYRRLTGIGSGVDIRI